MPGNVWSERAGREWRASPSQGGRWAQGTNGPVHTAHPAINAFDFSHDIVSGKAPASKFFDVWVQSYSSPAWAEFWTGSDASGNFSVDTTGRINLLSTETSEAEIYYQDKPTGNVTDLTRVYGP
jgi:hypothetical protein